MEGVQDTNDPECIHETTNQATDPQPTPKITHSSLNKMMPQDVSLKALIHVLAYKRCLCGDIEWGAREWGGGEGVTMPGGVCPQLKDMAPFSA